MISILLTGKTGCGKSATGNSILNKKVFRSLMSTSSVTKKVEMSFVRYKDREIKVVDSPGLLDTDLSPEQSAILVSHAISQAVAVNPDGYDAIVYVCEMGRFTREDVTVIGQLKAILGPDFFRKHCLIGVTHADGYDEAEEDGVTLEEWIRQQEGPFAEARKECCDRVVAFDNITDDPEVQNKQMETLLKHVDSMVAQSGRYDGGLFEQARAAREKLLDSQREPRVSEDDLKKITLLIDEIRTIDVYNDQNALEKLEDVKKKAIELKDKINIEDKETGKLKDLVKQCKSITKLVKRRIKEVNKIKEYKIMADDRTANETRELSKTISDLKEQLCKIEKENVQLQSVLRNEIHHQNVLFGLQLAGKVLDLGHPLLSLIDKGLDVYKKHK